MKPRTRLYFKGIPVSLLMKFGQYLCQIEMQGKVYFVATKQLEVKND